MQCALLCDVTRSSHGAAPCEEEGAKRLRMNHAAAEIASTSVVSSLLLVMVGRAGPILLEDFQTLEKLATLHRERIPPRVVHAKGAAAKGYFEVWAPRCWAASPGSL